MYNQGPIFNNDPARKSRAIWKGIGRKLSGIFMKKRFERTPLSYLSIWLVDFDEKMNLCLFGGDHGLGHPL
jgi:hypothetical protein